MSFNAHVSVLKTGLGKVAPIANPDNDKKKPKSQLFSHPYTNTWVCSRKNGGKTSLLFHILKRLLKRNTIVITMCPSHSKDVAWRSIIEWLDEHERTHFEYYGLNDRGEDEGDEAESPIDSLIHYLKTSTDDPKLKLDYVIIFDDLGTEVRDRRLSNLLKKNRHFKCNIIISSQFATDLEPQAIAQIDNCFLSKGNNIDKLEHVCKLLDLPIEFDEFNSLYNIGTERPFSFLHIDTRKNKYYSNFDYELIDKAKP